MAKMKVVAFVYFAGMKLFFQNLFCELPWRHQRQVASERQQQYCIQAAGLEQAQLLRSRRDQLEAGIGPQNAHGMGLEGDRHRLGALLPGAAHDFLEHVTVGAMDAVKIPDAHQRRSVTGGDVLEFVEDLHEPALAQLFKLLAHIQKTFLPLKFQIPVSSRRTRAARLQAETHWFPDAANRGKCA